MIIIFEDFIRALLSAKTGYCTEQKMKKSLMENFVFCAVLIALIIVCC